MRNRSSLSERFFFIINLIMVFIYAGTGILLLSGGKAFFPGKTSVFFGAALLLYAGWRAYSIFRKFKNKLNENPE